jgi:hypothetical protein
MPMPIPFSPFGFAHHQQLAQPHTLERFSVENFRQPTRISGELKFNQKIFKKKQSGQIPSCRNLLWQNSGDIPVIR